ncbi:MAG: PadR family transcriptional regulator [Nanoarchaeota archaeon]|nr:PadR family transcriptional regulator [Nanoarchaeota archaeon]
MYKGSLKTLVLKALSHKDMSGYSIMIFLEQATGKKPSAGSIYPLLDELRKENLVSVRSEKRRKIYSLTKAGKIRINESLKNAEDIHQRLIQTLKMFSTLASDEELAQIKEMLSILENNKNKMAAFQHEMIPFKMELVNLLRDDKKDKIIKAKKIIVEATGKLKRL